MLQDTSRKTFLSLDKRLKNGDGLQDLVKRVQKDNQLTGFIREFTGLPENSFFVVISDTACLTLNSSSASVATRLRMMSTDIIKEINNREHSTYKELKVQVRPMYTKKRIKHAALRKISHSNAALLRETAEHVSNPELSRILMRLASHERHEKGKEKD